jgi:integrase
MARQEELRSRALLLVVIFTGLRGSELRGLAWPNTDLKKDEVHVRQRADRYNEIDKPKSEAGERTIPLPPIVANTLREWKLVCPRRNTGRKDEQGNPVKELYFVFPNGAGKVENHANIINRILMPSQVAAGICTIVKDADGEVMLDDDGEPIRKAKYTGLHALRHFYASWCINRKVDGGIELPPKVIQERLPGPDSNQRPTGYQPVSLAPDAWERKAIARQRSSDLPPISHLPTNAPSN